jgi:uncharacterized protein with NAD-binding domain and iron-sulfur cluster
MKKRVIILGGGVAGMSAAHELAERSFEVEVFELKSIPGGKARSISVEGTGKAGRQDLPGEHGFRFFPRFYQHITDTMKRIPYGHNFQGVFDNLVDTTRVKMTRFDRESIVVPTKFPSSLGDFQLIIKDLFNTELELSDAEIQFFTERTWQLITSCHERRLEEYEKIGWWEYLEADRHSPAYRNLLVKGFTRSLVASKAELASARTVGNIYLQLLFDLLRPGVSSDRILSGPTNEVWINPWLNYLQSLDVRYHFNSEVEAIRCENNTIKSITICDSEKKDTRQVEADYYIAALPIEIMAGLLNEELIQLDPSLENIKRLSLSTAWMNGIQFYLKEDVEVIHGHVLYVDSPWALTSISQQQFWSNFNLSDYGDGTVRGIISVCISDWGFYIDPTTGEAGVTDSKGSNGKRANHCTREEIEAEVWYQLKQSLNANGQEILKDENLISFFLDPDIISSTPRDLERVLETALSEELRKLFIWIMENEGNENRAYVTLQEIATFLDKNEMVALQLVNMLVARGFVKEVEAGSRNYRTRLEAPENINLEPLLVNLINTWHLRPEAATRIPNFFLASDYVRTGTDLATMEGANEAARRAVNGIIDASGAKVSYCKIWELEEPEVFSIWRWSDYMRFKLGLPWNQKLPLLLQLLQNTYFWFRRT